MKSTRWWGYKARRMSRMLYESKKRETIKSLGSLRAAFLLYLKLTQNLNMKRLLLILSVFLIVSCKETPKEETREDIVIKMATQDLISNLRDPESFKLYGAYSKPASNGWGEYVFVDYGAKNGYGGMSREIIAYHISGSSIVKKMSMDEYTKEIAAQESINNKPDTFSFKDNPGGIRPNR